jgi:hypothetical protein
MLQQAALSNIFGHSERVELRLFKFVVSLICLGMVAHSALGNTLFCAKKLLADPRFSHLAPGSQTKFQLENPGSSGILPNHLPLKGRVAVGSHLRAAWEGKILHLFKGEDLVNRLPIPGTEDAITAVTIDNRDVIFVANGMRISNYSYFQDRLYPINDEIWTDRRIPQSPLRLMVTTRGIPDQNGEWTLLVVATKYSVMAFRIDDAAGVDDFKLLGISHFEQSVESIATTTVSVKKPGGNVRQPVIAILHGAKISLKNPLAPVLHGPDLSPFFGIADIDLGVSSTRHVLLSTSEQPDKSERLILMTGSDSGGAAIYKFEPGKCHLPIWHDSISTGMVRAMALLETPSKATLTREVILYTVDGTETLEFVDRSSTKPFIGHTPLIPFFP